MSTPDTAVNTDLPNNLIGEFSFSSASPKQLAWQDIKQSFIHWRIWMMLAYQDIKLRYRRSLLGPFWITISMAITVYSMGYLYSYLFRIPFSEYFPYLMGGMLGWSLISNAIPDLVDTFLAHDSMIKQIKLPYTLYVHKVAARNFMIFFHNFLIVIPVMIIFHNQITVDWHLLLLLPGLAILYLNCFCYGLIFAIIGGRYRDISQIIKSLVQIVFFVTPIMWKPSVLPASKQFIVFLNPVYALIELVRAPLVGYAPSAMNMVMLFITSVIGMIFSYLLFVSRRARIIYWL